MERKKVWVKITSWSPSMFIEDAKQDGAEGATVKEIVALLEHHAAAHPELHDLQLCPGDGYYDEEVVLKGWRPETAEEYEQRLVEEVRQERMGLLRQIKDHAHPRQLRQHEREWRQQQSALVQQRGWDKLSNPELQLVLQELKA